MTLAWPTCTNTRTHIRWTICAIRPNTYTATLGIDLLSLLLMYLGMIENTNILGIESNFVELSSVPQNFIKIETVSSGLLGIGCSSADCVYDYQGATIWRNDQLGTVSTGV